VLKRTTMPPSVATTAPDTAQECPRVPSFYPKSVARAVGPRTEFLEIQSRRFSPASARGSPPPAWPRRARLPPRSEARPACAPALEDRRGDAAKCQFIVRQRQRGDRGPQVAGDVRVAGVLPGHQQDELPSPIPLALRRQRHADPLGSASAAKCLQISCSLSVPAVAPPAPQSPGQYRRSM